MASTLQLDPNAWDLMLDANGNIAVLAENSTNLTLPSSLSQDAASAIKTFLGECYWDTTIGVPYLTRILGHAVPLSLLKQLLVDAALTASPDIASAQVFISSFSLGVISGQVQIVSSIGQASMSTFSTISPQGVG